MKLKLKLNKLQKLLPVFIKKKKKKKPDLSKMWETIRSVVNVGQKCKYIPCCFFAFSNIIFGKSCLCNWRIPQAL